MLDELQAVLVSCCTAPDSAAALAEARGSHPELAPWLETVDVEGLRLTGLLIRKLRFERIVRGDSSLAARFEAAPADFTAMFRKYLVAESPSCVFPEDEAARFRRFIAQSES